MLHTFDTLKYALEEGEGSRRRSEFRRLENFSDTRPADIFCPFHSLSANSTSSLSPRSGVPRRRNVKTLLSPPSRSEAIEDLHEGVKGGETKTYRVGATKQSNLGGGFNALPPSLSPRRVQQHRRPGQTWSQGSGVSSVRRIRAEKQPVFLPPSFCT